MVLTAVQLLASGCSSDSSDGGGFPEYEGTWRVELGTAAAPNSIFTLTCTGAAAVDVPLWDKLVFEQGTVSDLVETSGPATCQFPFQIDAGKSTASVPATDPYTGMPVTCTAFVGSQPDPVTMDKLDFFLDVTPAPWTFKLLAPVKGKPPTGQLTGSSAGALSVFDETTNMAAGTNTSCHYDLLVNVTKLAQN